MKFMLCWKGRRAKMLNTIKISDFLHSLLIFEEQSELIEKYSDIPTNLPYFPENKDEYKVWRKEN